jgi:N-acetylgalactosamine kinase
VARGRPDTLVRARNADASTFSDLEFSLEDELRQVRLDEWRDYVDSDFVANILKIRQGDWRNYLEAPMLRLQRHFRDRYIRGVDCVVSGDIPMAAGLSSSSALVVAMAEALVLTNQLDMAPAEFVDLCGEGEWFVGTRGGAADHAAVKLSQIGQVTQVGFFPFAVHETVPFPEDHALVICNSRIHARKASGARQTFNERVASYGLAVELVRKRFPNYAPLIHHLRDICPETLGIRGADVYRILLDVPETITPAALEAELGGDTFAQYTRSHEPPEQYHLRGRLLFGIAECERGKRCVRYLKDGDTERLGWMMNVSHDGDRVATGDGAAYTAPADDAYIRARIAGLQSEDPDSVLDAQLYAQPGAYACSLPEIDAMVDLALGVPGVKGAQLAGAGLGGCMMVLVVRDAAPAVIDRMTREYYAPRGLEPAALPVVPIAGCSALAMA